MAIIVGRKGSQTFPISDMTVSEKHVKLTEQPNGKIMVEDLGSSNGTYINGMRIAQKIVDKDTIIYLGTNYSFKAGDAFANIEVPPPPPPPPPLTEYSIKHLEAVWNEYDSALIDLATKNKNIGLISRLSSVFTIGGGVLGGILRNIDGMETFSNISLVASALGLIIMVYSIIKAKSFDYTISLRKLNDEFEQKYLCPKCKHFLGYKKYSLLCQDKQCLYCHGKFKTE